MKVLAWMLLLAALSCGMVWGAGSYLPVITQYVPHDITGGMLYAAAPALFLGVLLMSRTGASGWPVVVGYIAAALWVIAVLAFSASSGAGGAMVIGILFTLPALAISTLLQLAAMIGFATQKPQSA